MLVGRIQRLICFSIVEYKIGGMFDSTIVTIENNKYMRICKNINANAIPIIIALVNEVNKKF